MEKVSPNNVCEGPRGKVSGHVSATNIEVNVIIFGLGTLVKKVIVTNVLEPTLSLNIDTTNVLSQSRCLLHLFSLQAKLSLMKRITASNSRSKGPYPRFEEPTRRSEE